MRLALVLLAALLAGPAHADALTLVGQLGSRDILVELTQPIDGAVAGRFTFMDRGGDIPLTAVSHTGNRWFLKEEAPCGADDCRLGDSNEVLEAPVAATWELTYDPETYMASGVRIATGSKAKRQNLELMVMAWRVLDEGEEPSALALHERSADMYYDGDRPLDWFTAPYEMTLFEYPFTEGPERVLDAATVRAVTDPRTRFAFPRVIAFAGGQPVGAVNAVLADRHYRLSLSALECLAFAYASYGMDADMTMFGGHLAGFEEEQVALTYASPHLVSWTESGSLFCTGSHPYNHFNSFTADPATGKMLDLSRILSAWVPREQAGPSAEIADAAAAAKDPDGHYWGPSLELMAYLRENLPPDLLFQDAEMDETCYGDRALARYLNIRFEPGPVAVFTASGYPNIDAFCNGDLLRVPLADLDQFLAPTAKDYFPELDL